MSLFSDIERLITEHGSASILKERLLLAADKAKTLEDQVEKLKCEVSTLEKRCAKLQSELSAKTRTEEFVEHRGALFKRKPDGSYHLAVYCPICHKPAGPPHPSVPYCCNDKCGWVGSFTSRHLSQLIAEIQNS